MGAFVLNKIKNIKIYTTNWCVYCVLAKRYLDENGIAYEEINIEKEGISREEMMKLTKGYSVPQIIINGSPIGGYDSLMKIMSMNKD